MNSKYRSFSSKLKEDHLSELFVLNFRALGKYFYRNSRAYDNFLKYSPVYDLVASYNLATEPRYWLGFVLNVIKDLRKEILNQEYQREFIKQLMSNNMDKDEKI
jgi:hypothetical protein